MFRRAAILVAVLAESGCGASSPTTPGPAVSSISPADGATGVALLPTITVTFDEAMDPQTIDADVAGDCTGTIQISASTDFDTCIALEDQPLVGANARSFQVTPAAAFATGVTIRVRVLRVAESADGRRLRAEYLSESGFTTSTGPAVVTTAPADGAVAIAGTSFSVTFDRPMASSTVTVNDATEFCTGSIQLSADGFATCVRMAEPPASADATTFTFAAAAPLPSAATLKLRVTTAATSQTGSPLPLAYETPAGFTTRYRHPITIDGTNDFLEANERFATASAGYFGWVAWDEQWVYLAMQGTDVASASPTRWVLVYFGGANGTTTGQIYNTQQPGLPFSAKWHLRWKADNTLTSLQTWDGMAWIEDSFGGSVFQSGTFLEMRIPRSDLGDPATLKVHMSMINEAGGGEFTFAGVPAGSFTDAVDPDYTKYFDFDLNGSALPAAYVALP